MPRRACWGMSEDYRHCACLCAHGGVRVDPAQRAGSVILPSSKCFPCGPSCQEEGHKKLFTHSLQALNRLHPEDAFICIFIYSYYPA